MDPRTDGKFLPQGDGAGAGGDEPLGLHLDQIEQAARLQAQAGQAVTVPQSTVSLTDAKVDGNRASATATVTNQNGSEEQTLIFEREDGRWKLCN